MRSFSVRHTTVYSYKKPVEFGPHRMMLRPRDSHDLRLKEAWLTCSPPATVAWFHDVYGNSVGVASFVEPAAELRIESNLKLDQWSLDVPAVAVDQKAAEYPFTYSADERLDLGQLQIPQYRDQDDKLKMWAEGFVAGPKVDTLALLADLNNGIKNGFAYQPREEKGTQSPVETIEHGSGTCRDFAVLMAEAARVLGFGARLVTGYLYSPHTDGARGRIAEGAGDTHAWLEIYLPGAGWIAYDPTNSTVASSDLIRIAVARDISQIIPIAGSFTGATDDFVGMVVTAAVTSEPTESVSKIK